MYQAHTSEIGNHMVEDLLDCGWLLSHTNATIYFYFLFT